jgi:hypothetical protein
MATTDLKTFLENRLTVLDPAIDLSAGSPAQVQFIDPVIAYLGTDPLETDIKTFILDRFEQEFPDVFAGDPGVVSDTFVKPLILMLEPFKREIQSIRRNQSLKDPTVLSDDDADALVANVFDERSSGGLSGGVARLFFPNPTNVQVEITARLFTASGLNFYPSVPVSITAEEMVFNKSGSLFFMDITVQAEQAGVEYNIPKNTLTGVQGITGAIKVDNPRDFSDGATKLDTPTFVAQARGSLTERSLVTRRGATALLRKNFDGTVRAVQIIGAGDSEMQRDIISATSPGHAFLTGKVGLFQKMAYVRCRTVDAGSTTTPVVSVGDQVYAYLSPANPTYAGVSQQDRFVRFTISEVLMGPLQHPADPEFQLSFLVRYSEAVPAVMSADVTAGAYFEGGISKKGTVTVSSIPGATLAAPISVNSQEVHVLGHTDVYVRPVLQNVSSAVVNSLSADPGLANLQRSTLSSYSTNLVADTASPTPIDFEAAGVVAGNFLVIESGGDVGTYVIRKVVGSSLYLGANLASTSSNIRYRIVSDITINPFDTRILKLPFGTVPNNDLQTVIGSSTFVFTAGTTDLLNYGVKVGDVIKVSGSAVDDGSFVITGFIDGQHVLVDRAAAGSESSLTYEVFTPLESVQLPLVRLKELMVLDSAKQSTGVIVPPADPVAVIPAGNITSAQVRGSSEKRSGFVLPDLTQFMSPLPVSPAASHASTPAGRYSSGFIKSLGVYGSVLFANGTKDEFDFLPQMFGKCSYFVATSEDTTKAESFPPVDPKPGDAFTIKSGPNKGDYLIKDVTKFRYTKSGPNEFVWAYLIEIYGTFPVDVVAELTAFINLAIAGAGPVPTFNYSTTDLAVPSYLQTTIYSNLATWLSTALLAYGSSAPTITELQAAIDSMVLVDYEWGDPARGVLRSFFSNPTLFQQHTASNENPTMFSFKTVDGSIIKFRSDPHRYEKQEIVPPRLASDAVLLEYPRDGEELWLLPYSGLVGSFVAGDTLTGSTSSKTGSIVADVVYGSAGTLLLRTVSGAFSFPETITGSGGGSATTAGLLQPGMVFTSEARATAFNLGVQAGDVVEVREEFLLHGSVGTDYPAGSDTMSAVQTVFNSTQVTFVNNSTPFTTDMVGGLLFIEEGKDKGGYSISKVIDSKTLVLDRPLTESTPAILVSGHILSWGWDGVKNLIIDNGIGLFTTAHVNKYITIYGIDVTYQGSYKIKSFVSSSTVEVDRGGFGVLDFPAPQSPNPFSGWWVITDAPPAAPTKTGSPTSSTELYGLRPIRIYRHIPTEYPITTVLTSPSVSAVGFDRSQTLDFCKDSPFRIFRRDIRRVTPYEMSLSSQGGLFYFDTEVVSTGPSSSSNLAVQSYLTVDDGTFESEGYRHVVDDNTLTYSTKESGKLFIPSTILPVSSPDSTENVLSLVGVPLQISYERGDVVQSVQDFVSSPEDRVTTANLLARHFLPSYVYYDATYIGGSVPGVVAKDIISYIDNLAVESPIDVSLVQQLIENRGGNIETPTAVFIILHDWDRKRWMEFSANRIGGTETLVPYNGTPRVSFFVAGPDVSGQSPLPEGERINLTQV